MSQVLINFDIDETKVQENAEKEAGRQIAREIMDRMFGKSYYTSRDAAIKKYLADEVRAYLEPYKSEIIEGAVKTLVNTLARTKKVKEKTAIAIDKKTEQD